MIQQLTLAEYKGLEIFPGKDPTSAANADEIIADVTKAPCRATIGAEGGDVACDFAFTTITGATLVANVYAGGCGTMVDNVKVGGAAVTKEGDNSNAAAEDTDFVTTPALAVSFTVAEKNNEIVTKKFCARADVLDDTADLSVFAYMLEVTTTTTFALNANFSTTVSTASFDAAMAAASAKRDIVVGAVFGACGQTVSASEVTIGTVLDICVSVDDNDSDVKIDKIHSVTIKDNADEDLLTTPIDGDGKINLVTTLSPNVNAENGGSSEIVTISVLMTPILYDSGSGTIKITGSVVLLYVDDRRLSSSERSLQSEEAPFSMEVDLTKNNLPQVAMNNEENGAMSTGVAMMAFAAGVAALF